MTYLIYSVLFNIATSHDSLKLVERAVYISSLYYNHEHVTSVVWSNKDSESVTIFLMKFRGPVVLTPLIIYDNSIFIDKTQHFGYLQTVFFASKLEEFEQFMYVISEKLRYPIRLILVLKKSVKKSSELYAYNQIAGQNNLADIVIVYKNHTDNKISLSTYYPYSNNVCGNFIPVHLKPSENMFPDKFENFNKCPIRVGARQHSPLVILEVTNGTVTSFNGFDASVLKIIMQILNATYEVKELYSYGHSYSNGTTSGGFNDLVNNITDILIPSGILNLDRYSVTLPSHGYNDPRIRWIGPKRREMYQWIKLLIPFLNNVTPFLWLTFVLFVIVAILIRRRTSSRRRYKSGSLCFRAFSLLVGQVVKFTTRVPLLNNIFLIWIWFCFILRIAYQGILVNSLHKTVFEPRFDELREAVKHVDGYGGLTVFIDYYKDTPLGQDFIVMPRPVFYTYLDRVLNGERYLLVSDSYLFHSVRRNVQVLNEPVSSSLSCLYMRPGWPAAHAIDSIIVKLQEAGITDKFLNLSNDIRNDEAETDKSLHRLNMSVVGSCFFVMGFMWLACSITFVIEILYYKYTHIKYTH